ncbi:hypothetical protein AWENTII_002419 [Aspergillus wentii]
MPPPWRFDWTGRIYLIKDKYVLIEEQLTEAFNEAMGQYHILTLARYHTLTAPILSEDQSCDNFLDEIELVKTVAQIGHGPQFIDQVSQRGGSPYPNGLVDFIVMSRVPGENVGEIFLDLTSAQLQSIKRQLTHILE